MLHDPDAYLARAPKLVRSTAPMYARLGFGPANMATNTLPVPPEAVLDAMRRHCPGFQFETQPLQEIDGKPYDVLTWHNDKGEERTVYFDISVFFGR